MSGFKPITPEIMKVREFDKDVLTQYSCDEIQLVRQQAQSATSNEISFNMKLPDPSALLHSTVWLLSLCVAWVVFWWCHRAQVVTRSRDVMLDRPLVDE